MKRRLLFVTLSCALVACSGRVEGLPADYDAGTTAGDGGASSVLTELDYQPIAVAVVGGGVYVALFLEGIVSVPSGGGAVTPKVPSVNTNAFSPVPESLPTPRWPIGPRPSLPTRTTSISLSAGGMEAEGPSTRVPYGDPTPVALASSCAAGIAVDEANVYWLGEGALNEVPIAGGSTRVIASRPGILSGGPAVDDENVYWGVTPQLGSCGLCPSPPKGEINALMRAPK